MYHNFYDLSWKVTEPEYREDKALSYSTIARYDREGFNNLDKLFDKQETQSLTFGSAVDALITGGQEEFDNNFMVAEFPPIKESVLTMVKAAFNNFCDTYRQLIDIPDKDIIFLTEVYAFQLNWKPETRAKVIKEQGNEYYSLLYAAGNRKILSTEVKEEVDNAVEILKTSEATKEMFAPNNPFDTSIIRYYQLKFKDTIDEVKYRCMADLITVDYKNKIVYPIDLKTSSKTEWDFYKSFIEWKYSHQARLYWKIIRDNMDKDSYFKDFTLANYRFVVVNKKTLTPLVWEYEDTQKRGTLYYGKNKQIEFKDPLDIGKELSNYLSSRPTVPNNIKISENNSIVEWLNKL